MRFNGRVYHSVAEHYAATLEEDVVPMDTIPQTALDEIVRRPNGPMYRHEWIQMSNELQSLRKRFNAGEDLRILDQFVSAWGDETGASLRKRLTDMKDGDTLIIPGIGYRWRVVKENSSWVTQPATGYASGIGNTGGPLWSWGPLPKNRNGTP